MKRVFALVLSLMLLMLNVSAFAAEERNSNYFSSYGTAISRLGSGDLKITFSCDAVGTASQLGVSSFSIYEYDGSRWELVSGPHSGSYGYNVSSYSFSRTFNGVAGEKYRVQVNFLCTKSDGTSENKSYTSGSIVAN